MHDEISIPRQVPAGLHAEVGDFGFEAIEHALAKMTTKWGDTYNLTTIGFALFASAGSGKSSVAAHLFRLVQQKCPWLSTLRALWVPATWIASHSTPQNLCNVSGDEVPDVLATARLLAIDGLGEEPERMRERVAQVLKARLDAGRPTIITSRLPLDGTASVAAFYPGLRRMLERSFVYVAS